jgi:hypothetical protein
MHFILSNTNKNVLSCSRIILGFVSVKSLRRGNLQIALSLNNLTVNFSQSYGFFRQSSYAGRVLGHGAQLATTAT